MPRSLEKCSSISIHAGDKKTGSAKYSSSLQLNKITTGRDVK